MEWKNNSNNTVVLRDFSEIFAFISLLLLPKSSLIVKRS